jgi:glycosyltransferase involved in cell wall biosynthesis
MITQAVPLEVRPDSVVTSPTGNPFDVSVIVYVNRDLENAAQLYAYVANLLREMGKSFEFIFIDDGNAKAIAYEIEGFHKFVRDTKVIRLPRSYGPSTAMSEGFRLARGRLVLTLGSFLQVQPEEIRKMFKKVEEGYHFVNGWRVNRKDAWLNRLHSTAYNWAVRKVSEVDLHDSNCTLKLFRKEVVDDLPFYGDLYRFLPIMAARQGYLVGEVAVDQRRESNGTGFYSPWTYFRRTMDLVMLFFLSRFTMTPLRFFGTIGGVLFLAGFGINFYLTLVKFFADQPLADRPLLFLGILFMLLGIQIGSVGLIGELVIFTTAKRLKNHHVEKILE